MKVAYINGFKGENSSKPKKLSKILGLTVDHIVYDYNKNNIQKIEDKAKNYDVIIASSTGAYIARSIAEKHNIALISLNPVINLEKTFKKLNVKVPDIPKPNYDILLEEIVLLNKDDELIDYREAEEIFKKKNQCKVYEKGGHRFENLEEVAEDIKEFLKFLFI